MAQRLLILDDPWPPREVIPAGETMEIGRAPQGAIVISDRSVSRRHAFIRQVGGELLLEDAGSTFGTYVNDRPLPAGEAIVLRDGDVLRFGRIRVVCRFDPEVVDLEDATRAAAFAAQANARLLLLEGEYVRRLPLSAPHSLIGCAPHCEVRLQDRDGPPEQALIRAGAGEFRLESRSQTHPPRLNELPAPLAGPVPLPSNSALVLHRAQALFLYDFIETGEPVVDPLRALPRRLLLRQVAEQSGHCRRALSQLCQDRRALGQALGDILVEKGLVTPLTWRAFCARLVRRSRRRSWMGSWFQRRGTR